MLPRTQIALTLAVLLVAPGGDAAEPSRRSWIELSQTVKDDWTIRLQLPDATVVEGNGARFTGESLMIQVSKSSNPQAHPAGELAVPRNAVKTLEVRGRRIGGQVLGLAVPLGAGAAIAGAGGRKGAFQGGGLMLAGCILGLAAIPLYFAGRSRDRRWETITVAP
jgi:hypothetical protein